MEIAQKALRREHEMKSVVRNVERVPTLAVLTAWKGRVNAPAVIVPGERTGRFRLGNDELLISKDGESGISQADYAIAFVDELDRPVRSGRRFTVGY